MESLLVGLRKLSSRLTAGLTLEVEGEREHHPGWPCLNPQTNPERGPRAFGWLRSEALPFPWV